MATRSIALKKRPRRTRGIPRPNPHPALHAALGSLSDARSVLETSCRALEADERQGDPVVALRIGMTLLDVSYAALDAATRRGNSP
jgi:hypothetical protein